MEPDRRPSIMRHPLYGLWKSLACRCRKRGHPLEPSWAADLHAFAAGVGERPDGHVLVPIDRGLGYVAGNVQWISREALAAYHPKAHKIDGLTLGAIARRHGMDRMAFIMRIRRGWTVEEALSIPIRGHSRTRRDAC